MLTVSPALWNLPLAQAQPANSRQSHKTQQQAEKKHNTDRARQTQESEQTESKKQKSHYEGSVPIGGYFQDHHREAAREYYGRQENRGYCPPGLAKKGNDCQPPGHVKKWQRGYPLPSGVVYYEVPRSVVVSLGPPPTGYQYVRLASDILLISVGTRMVVDAIEDLVH